MYERKCTITFVVLSLTILRLLIMYSATLYSYHNNHIITLPPLSLHCLYPTSTPAFFISAQPLPCPPWIALLSPLPCTYTHSDSSLPTFTPFLHLFSPHHHLIHLLFPYLHLRYPTLLNQYLPPFPLLSLPSTPPSLYLPSSNND